MPESIDIDAVLLLMEHFLEIHSQQARESTEKIVELARSIGLERGAGESLEGLVERARSLTSQDSYEEEPPTLREGRAVIFGMPTGTTKPPSSMSLPVNLGGVGPGILSQGQTGSATGMNHPFGMSGVTGYVPEPPYEDLHHHLMLPFTGHLECYKQGNVYGIMYFGAHLEKTPVAAYINSEYEFPITPGKPWLGVQPFTSLAYEGVSTVVEALVLNVTYHVVNGAIPHWKDLYDQFKSNPIWERFLEGATKTFQVAGVMTP